MASLPEEGAFDPETQQLLNEVNGCQRKIDLLYKLANEEYLRVDQRAYQLQKPYFQRRSEIIRRIPNFWQMAINNHRGLTSLFNETEKDCFHSLFKLEVEEYWGDEYLDIKSGHRIKFFFAENAKFENIVLMKEFKLHILGTLTSSSVPIIWKEGQQPTANHQLNDYPLSFFVWYGDNMNPSLDTIADRIKDELWPYATHYFYNALAKSAEGDDDNLVDTATEGTVDDEATDADEIGTGNEADTEDSPHESGENYLLDYQNFLDEEVVKDNTPSPEEGDHQDGCVTDYQNFPDEVVIKYTTPSPEERDQDSCVTDEDDMSSTSQDPD